MRDLFPVGSYGRCCYLRGPEAVLKIKGLRSRSVLVAAVGNITVGACVLGGTVYGWYQSNTEFRCVEWGDCSE